MRIPLRMSIIPVVLYEKRGGFYLSVHVLSDGSHLWTGTGFLISSAVPEYSRDQS